MTRPASIPELIERIDDMVGARPYAPVAYEAFRIADGRASRIRIAPASSLTAAVDAAKLACLHREHLAIRETGDDGARVHLYVIRKAAPRYVHPAGEIMPRRVADLYAEPVCVLPGELV